MFELAMSSIWMLVVKVVSPSCVVCLTPAYSIHRNAHSRSEKVERQPRRTRKADCQPVHKSHQRWWRTGFSNCPQLIKQHGRYISYHSFESNSTIGWCKSCAIPIADHG